MGQNKMSSSIKTLYESYRSGNHLTDDELKSLYYHVRDTVNNLGELGPMFHVTFVYLLRDQTAMADYLRNRGVDF